MTTTTIKNNFTGYEATITTKADPAISTIKRHLRNAKAHDCKSETIIRVNGIRCSIIDRGHGPELLACE